MSKGSIFWGKSRGKLGEMVLSVVKGQETQRAYNGQPANPKTTTQTTQRALFATAVKFYKSAVINYFPFAFQDKKQNESDYNAFMRHNAKLGMIIKRSSFNNPAYPAIGNFMLTQGELEEIAITSPQGSDIVEYALHTTIEIVPKTAQELASVFAEGYGLQNGDIITFTYVKSSLQDITDEPSILPKWRIVQIMVGDTSDNRTLGQISTELGATFTPASNVLQMYLDTDYAAAICSTISRNTPNGLKVSNSYIRMNDVAQTAYNDSLQTSFRNEALDSWGRKADPILKGSLVP